MRKILAALAATVLLVAGAHARTIYVSPNGIPASGCGGNGADSAHAMKWSCAQDTAVAGDIVRLTTGTYGAFAPRNSGTSASRITYIGNPASPSLATVATIAIRRQYTSVKGITALAPDDSSWTIGPFTDQGFTGSNAIGDSLYNCVLGTPGGGQPWRIRGSATNFTISTSRVYGDRFQIVGGSADDTLRIRFVTISDSYLNIDHGSQSNSAWATSGVRNLDVLRDSIGIHIKPSGNGGAFKTYSTQHSKFTDVHLSMKNDRPDANNEDGTSYWRDSTHHVAFLRDTFDFHAGAGFLDYYSSSGLPAYYNDNFNLSWRSCLFRSDAFNNKGVFSLQELNNRDTVFACTFISTNMITLNDEQGSFATDCKVSGNTFINLGGLAAKLNGCIVAGNDTAWTTNNIFYSGASGQALAASQDYHGDFNLFWSGAAAGNSIDFHGLKGPGPAGTMCSNYTYECRSKFANPLFYAPSTDPFTFDSRLRPGSPAIGMGISGATVGSGAVVTGALGYYVSPPTGDDTYDGTTATYDGVHGPWATMAKANATLQPGDRAYLMVGSYDVLPNPVNSASSARTTFIGHLIGNDALTDTLHRKQIALPTGTITRPYVTIKGVAFDTLKVSDTADFDSLLACYGTGEFHYDGDYGVVAGCTFDGRRFGVGDYEPSNTCDSTLISNCVFRKLGSGYQGNGLPMFRILKADSLMLRFNIFNATIENPITSGPAFRKDSLVTRLFSRGNVTRVADARAGQFTTYWQRGGGSTGNTFDRDTVVFTSANSGGSIWPTASFAAGDLTGTSTWDSCSVNAINCQLPSYVYFQNGMAGCTLTYTTIAMNGPALIVPWVPRVPPSGSGSTINHCTLVGCPTPVLGSDASVVSFMNPYTRPAFQDTCLTFTNNIVYATTNTVAVGDTTTGLVAWQDATVDSAAAAGGVNRVDKTQKHILSNYNLYAFYGNGGSVGDRAWLNFGAPSARRTGSWKAGQPAPSSTWWNTDSLSRNGSPGFFDSTAAGFNPRLLGASAAIAAGSSATDIGAVAYASTPLTVVFPQTVTLDLSNPQDTTFVDVNNFYGNVGVAVQFPTSTVATQLNYFTGTGASRSQMGNGNEDQLSIGTERVFVALKSDAATVGVGTFLITASDGSGGHATFSYPVTVNVVRSGQ